MKHLKLTRILLAGVVVGAGQIQADDKVLRWKSHWIEAAGESNTDFEVCYFRKRFELETVPDLFEVKVSADPSYRLYVNGALVRIGPPSGDLFHWNYDVVDLAEHLETGSNTVAAIVWNEGENREEAKISHRTGFVLDGVGESASILNTDESWEGRRTNAYRASTEIGHRAYYVSGPGEIVEMGEVSDGWLQGDDNGDWDAAVQIKQGWLGYASPKGAPNATGWMLVPSILPARELTEQRFAKVRDIKGAESTGDFSWKIEANSEATILLDHGVLTNAYPRISYSDGAGSEIVVTYAETLFDSVGGWNQTFKGNRDEVAGKVMVGRHDVIKSAGGQSITYETLGWRTFRYVEIKVKTGAEALLIEDVDSVFTGYPFELKSTFASDDVSLEQIIEVGWRTARLCAVDTYMDCPYYEKLQYIGDARIQAMVSLYNSGDDRLLRNALNLMDQSRLAEGVTQSRHPSQTPQIISTFSLWYIGMLHDYWMYGSDASFVADKLDGMRQVLAFFHRFQTEDGRLKNAPYWLFTDWADKYPNWEYGEAPAGEKGESSVLDLQLLWAYQLASELEADLGMPGYATLYAARADQLKASILKTYWDASRNVILDTEKSDGPLSQHAQALGILTGTLDGANAREVAATLLTREDLVPASIYFRYYVHLAMAKAGFADSYLDWLDVWYENLDMGLTTWAEISEISKSRSDCHAWGSSPNVELYRIVLGIDSAAPEFSKVRICPALGKLERASGSIPHPLGTLSASYRKEGKTWDVILVLPGGLSGEFVWEGETYPLNSGENRFSL